MSIMTSDAPVAADTAVLIAVDIFCSVFVGQEMKWLARGGFINFSNEASTMLVLFAFLNVSF